MSGDRVDAESGVRAGTGATDEGTEAGSDWSPVNSGVIVAFTLLTLVGMALSVGWVRPLVAVPKGESAGVVTVPPYVYLYAGVGALGYIVTKVMVGFDRYTEWRSLDELVGMAMRIPAAWILATGIYLFVGDLGGVTETTGARFTAGVAFLVGLYVNVALKALGSLADRILGRAPRTSE